MARNFLANGMSFLSATVGLGTWEMYGRRSEQCAKPATARKAQNPIHLMPSSLRGMGEHQTDQKKRPEAKDLWRLILAIIGVVAIVQELRKPPEERTWSGKVAGFVPYDFRMPTMERFRNAYWNPDGPLITGRVWGVGWAPNLGAIKKRFSG